MDKAIFIIGEIRLAVIQKLIFKEKVPIIYNVLTDKSICR
jgi:hypothetical protein